MIKQVIVVNKNLNMPIGKLAAQVAHASMNSLMSLSYENQDEYYGLQNVMPLEYFNDDTWMYNDIYVWLETNYTKIVVYVKSEEKLLNIYEMAKERNLPCALVMDIANTFFSEPTYTCVGIGPCKEEDFIGITDKLRLL